MAQNCQLLYACPGDTNGKSQWMLPDNNKWHGLPNMRNKK